MPTKIEYSSMLSKIPWSVLEKVSTVPNPIINSSLIQEFYQFMMADNRESDSYKKKNNSKALILFSHELVPNATFYDVQKKEKIFLNF
jgi:murein L,D-transpeptidase YcbB/YkuD